MKKFQWITWTAIIVLLAISCGSDYTEDHSDLTEVVQVYRGHAVHGHEVRSFRPCGWGDPLWAIDPDDILWNLHKQLAPHQEPYQEIFAVVEAREVPAPTDGFGADYSGALQIEAVLYAGLEGPGCQEDWSAFRYRVYGNEPFWSVEVSDGHFRLSRLGSEDQFWHEITVERTAEGVRYCAIDGTAIPVELTVTRGPCRDSMSGAYYAFTALLRIGEEKLHGCALKGQI